MEFANNGDLFQKINEHQKKGTLFPESEIWPIIIQVRINKYLNLILYKIVKGLKALHDLKIFHRDLKAKIFHHLNNYFN